MNLKTYKIYTLGCKVNQYDSLCLKRKLDSAGLRGVENNADIAIINSCAVTATAINKSKRMLNIAKKESPEASIALLGCWPVIAKKRNYDFPPEADQPWADNVDFIFGVNEADRLIGAISNKNTADREASVVFDKSRARYTIKVQDGCEQFCSYCIIPFTRGKLKSRSEKGILEEISEALDSGYREVVLSGIHLGMYGRDRGSGIGGQGSEIENNKIKLTRLIKKIIKIQNIGRVRLSSIEPNEVNDELIALIKSSKKLCQHLHTPLQAGCNKILKAMNRPYTKDKFRKKIKKIRRSVPDIAITTDVIVGFPGESERDFEETLGFIKEISFSRLHIFPFSAHEETLASKLPHQLSEKIKIERAKKLRALGEQLKNKYQKQSKGKDLDFVIEQEKNDYYIGKSEYYFDYKIPKKAINKSKVRIGSIYKIKYL